MKSISKSVRETQLIAANLAKNIIKKRRAHAAVIALEGELGAGKTIFAQGFAKALGIKRTIKSPTFVLMKEYLVKKPTFIFMNIYPPLKTGLNLIHLDCYRLRDYRDLHNINFKEMEAHPENIILIEWPERIARILPKKMIKVHIDHISEHERKIIITG